MVVNTYDRHLDIGGWFINICAEFPNCPLYLHVVLKSSKEKTRMSKRIWLQGVFNLSHWKTAITFNQVLKSSMLYTSRIFPADYVRMY